MHLFKLGLFALAAEQAYGYLDTSPFFIFSTSELLIPSSQLRSAASLSSDLSETLSQCFSDIYIIVYQPGVSVSDYASTQDVPGLSRYMSAGKKGKVRSSAGISELVGDLDISRWQELLQTNCGAQVANLDARHGSMPAIDDQKTTLLNINLPMPAPGSRTQSLLNNDAFLASIIDTLPSQKYTVLYTTTSESGGRRDALHEASKYEMESPLLDSMHLDLKRDTDFEPSKSSSNQTLVDGPLFEKYQFLSPGIFMGFTAGILLLIILYCAISGVASLQVSYAAFDKETGALAQRKGQ